MGKVMNKNEWIIGGGVLVLGLLVPLAAPSLWLTVLSVFFFYAMMAISWNIIFGYAGLFSFCHPTFAAIGGYTSALLAEHMGLSPFAGLLIGASTAGFFGVVIGMLILRVRGFYLCLVTWAFGEMVAVVIKAEHKITGGTGGFLAPSFVETGNSDLWTYFIGLGLMLAVFVISAVLYHSKWGLYLFAVRDDIEAAESMGVKTRFWKVFGFAFGSALAGVAGVYYTHLFNVIDPTVGGIDQVGMVCLMVIIGGLGTVMGPLLGSFFVVILSELIRGWHAEFSLLIFALVMILTMRFLSGGFMEMIQVLVDRIKPPAPRNDAG
ncbi:MAG: branched-chain amino acid ABC transporter permease [Desulfobacterales bacterium]|nr:branched-chain amino acid ABC transporter permease [Desulfobacterales bacterium]